MLRRLMLVSLALCALAALAGCGVNRIAGPQVNPEARSAARRPARPLGADPNSHPREGDNGEPTFGGEPPTYAPAAGADSLSAGDDVQL